MRGVRLRLLALLTLLTAVCGDMLADESADTLRGVTLKEVTVRRGREHYSKRNNPAVDFARKVRQGGEKTDPRRNQRYAYRKYDRMSFGLNDFHAGRDSSALKGRFGFLREYVDTSDVTGLPVLPLSLKEKVTDVVYRREPKAEKQIVRALSSHGIDEVADLQNVQTMVEDVFREIDLYDDNVNLLQNRFVSPLSKIAPDFYKFYLTDTLTVNGRRCIVLSFAPRNPATFGFLGRLYVEQGDTTMFVRRVDMGVSPTINLNFIDRMRIVQEYERAADGSRLKTLDDFNAIIEVIKGTPQMYARRTTRYDNHTFSPTAADGYLDRLGDTFEDEMATTRDSVYWASARIVNPTVNERRIPQMLARMRRVPLFRYGEMFVKRMVVGYLPTGKNSKFDIGPLNTFISANTVEGLRLRLGGITTANLSPHWFACGYAAYGFKDHKWKYNAELEYSFNAKKYHSREFPVHSLRVSQGYDIDQLGQHYLFTNPDNVFLALKREPDRLITYRRHTTLRYELELNNNFSVVASASEQQQQAGPYVPLVTTDGYSIRHYDQTYFTLQLRYAPGEKFYQTKTSRIPINLDPWVVVLSHTYSPQGFLRGRYNVNKTELSVQKRFWFSAFGFADIVVKGGHVWSRSPYISLLTPNANLSYTIQPESYALLNPMEFIGDSFASWDVTYWLNGALLNYVPLLKRLKLREVVAFRGWLGSLSDKNNPRLQPAGAGPDALLMLPEGALCTQMHGKPYMEMSVGVDNFLKCLRVDYVWRLNYRSTPGVDRSGLRVAFHVTF